MSTSAKLEQVVKKVAPVVGTLSIAITCKALNRRTLQNCIERLKEAADELEQI